MPTFYILVIIYITGVPAQPFWVQSANTPFQTEALCKARAVELKAADMLAHACWPVPLPVREVPA